METNVANCVTKTSGLRKLYQLDNHDLFVPAESLRITLYKSGRNSICTSWVTMIQSAANGSTQFGLLKFQSCKQDSICISCVTTVLVPDGSQFSLYLLGRDSICTGWVTEIQCVPTGALQFSLYQMGHYDSTCTKWVPTIQFVPLSGGSIVHSPYQLDHQNSVCTSSVTTIQSVPSGSLQFSRTSTRLSSIGFNFVVSFKCFNTAV